MTSTLAADAVTLAKTSDGRLAQVVRVVDKVGFSETAGWILLCFDFELIERKRQDVKWVPASTQFSWVRQFIA